MVCVTIRRSSPIAVTQIVSWWTCWWEARYWFTAGVLITPPPGGHATGQHGAITAEQIGEAGMSPDQLRRRVQSGILEQVLHTRIAAVLCHLGPRRTASLSSTAVRRPSSADQAPPHSTVSTASRCGHRFTSPCCAVATCSAPTTSATPRPSYDGRPHDGVGIATMSERAPDRHRPFPPTRRLTTGLDAASATGSTSEEALHRRITQLRSSGRCGIRNCSR